MELKILIVGSGLIANILAEKLGKEVYISSDADIRDDNITELLKFVLENNIDLTIPISEKALQADIVSFFQANGQAVFGPAKQACRFMFDKSVQKKFLYRLHAQTSKFGIFNKIQLAQDYLNNAQYPLILYSSENPKDRFVCPTVKTAQNFLDDLAHRGNSEFLAEEYTFGNNFTIYFVTDGYTALPITSVHNYKKESDYTNIGCFTPNFRISKVIFERIGNIVKNILSTLDSKGNPYVGIIGVEGILTDEDKFYVSDLFPFFNEIDAEAVLNLVDDDLVKIFHSCVNGLFSDEYEEIRTNELSSVSELFNGKVYTETSSTLTRARENLKEKLI